MIQIRAWLCCMSVTLKGKCNAGDTADDATLDWRRPVNGPTQLPRTGVNSTGGSGSFDVSRGLISCAPGCPRFPSFGSDWAMDRQHLRRQAQHWGWNGAAYHTHIYIYIQYNIHLYTVYYIHILYTILYHTNSYSIVTWYKYFWQGPHTQVLTLDARAHQRNPLRNVQSYILPQEHLDSVQSWAKLSFKTKDKRSIAYCQWDEPHWEVIYSSITIWLYFTAWLHDTTWASSAEAMVQGATESPLMIHFP